MLNDPLHFFVYLFVNVIKLFTDTLDKQECLSDIHQQGRILPEWIKETMWLQCMGRLLALTTFFQSRHFFRGKRSPDTRRIGQLPKSRPVKKHRPSLLVTLCLGRLF